MTLWPPGGRAQVHPDTAAGCPPQFLPSSALNPFSSPRSLLLLLALPAIAAGCGDSAGLSAPAGEPLDRPVPRIGRGPGYELAPAGPAVASARPIAELRCGRASSRTYGAHLEVFANRLDVVIPAGIGVAPPRTQRGAYVTGGRCVYPARTLEPTGVIEIAKGATVTLGRFFDLWGRPLSRTRLLGFRTSSRRPVSAFVDGRRWSGDPRAIPLRRHAAIVVQVGGWFPPTARYVFPSRL